MKNSKKSKFNVHSWITLRIKVIGDLICIYQINKIDESENLNAAKHRGMPHDSMKSRKRVNILKVILVVILLRVALFISSLLTDGRLSVKLIGATIIAIGNVVSVAILTLISGWDNRIFVNALLTGTIPFALVGFVAISSLGIEWQVAINLVAYIINYVGNTLLNGNKITFEGILFNAVLGFAIRVIGEHGWMHDDFSAAKLVEAKNIIEQIVAIGIENAIRIGINILLAGVASGLCEKLAKTYNKKHKEFYNVIYIHCITYKFFP